MKIDSLYDGRFQSTRIDIAYLSILKNDNDLFALTKQNSWIMMLQKGRGNYEATDVGIFYGGCSRG